jgi:hypothetical protein
MCQPAKGIDQRNRADSSWIGMLGKAPLHSEDEKIVPDAPTAIQEI